MIISASRRTDIPSCYPEWFVRRLQQGFVYVRSPFDAHRLSKVALTPDVVDCIAFWTKNPLPLMPYLDRLEPYPYFFLFTLTGYGRNVEPGVPDKADVMIPAFQQLADRIGPDRVIWRYDPIFFTDTYTMAYHVRAFAAARIRASSASWTGTGASRKRSKRWARMWKGVGRCGSSPGGWGRLRPTTASV